MFKSKLFLVIACLNLIALIAVITMQLMEMREYLMYPFK